jgi:predicted nucleotidyltransferase
MRRDEALERLRPLLPALQQRFGVKSLALFGSVARDSAGTTSDVDVVVDFEGPATLVRYMGVKHTLEDELGVRVDVVNRRALKPMLEAAIAREAIDVA